jgi:hypothetical protein
MMMYLCLILTLVTGALWRVAHLKLYPKVVVVHHNDRFRLQTQGFWGNWKWVMWNTHTPYETWNKLTAINMAEKIRSFAKDR